MSSVLVFNVSCNNSPPPDQFVRMNDTLIIQKRFYKDGTLEAEISNTNDSQRHGTVKLYHPNGKLKYQYSQFNGNREGLAQAYFEDGSKHYVGKYHNDLKDSTWVWYYMGRGAMRLISNWNMGESEGLETGYFPNGKMEYSGFYHNGLKDSVWTWYKQDGSIDQIEIWDNGKVKDVK